MHDLNRYDLAKKRLYKALLKKHESLIYYGVNLYFKHEFRSSQWKQPEDLAQELRLLLWQSIDKVKEKNEKDIMKMFKTCMYRFINTEIGKNFLKKNKANHIYSIDTISVCGDDSKANKAVDEFTNHSVNETVFANENATLQRQITDENFQYRNLEFLKYLAEHEKDENAINIYKLIIFKPPQFVSFCLDYDKKYNKKTNLIRQTHLSSYLGISDVRISLILKHLRKVCNQWKKQNLNLA